MIDCEFPGGNIIVDEIKGDEIKVHQDLRDTEVDWFYWCFRVRGAQGRTLRFTFTRSVAIGVRGPGMSLDRGVTWKWLGAESVDGNSFMCTIPSNADEARFSFGMPYQLSDWQRFADTHHSSPHVRVEPLCVTKKGRGNFYALVGCVDGAPRQRVILTARHHCCEMMADYVMEGLVEWILTSAATEAEWLRENVQLLCVPFVDLDGVEDGDQGKSRRPRDHNRDYSGESIHPTTRALREFVPQWHDGMLVAGIDLHCPWISNEANELLFMVGMEDEKIAAQQWKFAMILEAARRGPLPFAAADLLPFGQSWNTGLRFSEGKSFARWVSEQPGVRLAGTIEVAYANAKGEEVNQASARKFGRDLGVALGRWGRDEC